MSLQSGCNETLKRMNRRYTIEQFKEVTNLLKSVYSDVSLTTDIIVGFPGETEEEFNKTYNFLKDIDFYQMHIFRYSPRKGTKAAIMKNQIDGKVKEERSNKLIDLSRKSEIIHNKKEIGRELEVLWEEKEDEYIKGHTSNYKLVKIPYQSIENTITKVKVNSIDNLELIGELVAK